MEALTALVVTVVTLVGFYFWVDMFSWSSLSYTFSDWQSAAEAEKSIKDDKESRNRRILILTSVGILVASVCIGIWTWLVGFHRGPVVAFVWPYAAWYAWARVVVKIKAKRPKSISVIFSFVVTIFALCTLFAVINVSKPFSSIFDPVILRFSTGAIQWMINGYALLGGSGLVLALALLVTLTIGSGRDFEATLQEKKRKEEESSRTISDDALRLAIKQRLDQGEKVSRWFYVFQAILC